MHAISPSSDSASHPSAESFNRPLVVLLVAHGGSRHVSTRRLLAEHRDIRVIEQSPLPAHGGAGSGQADVALLEIDAREAGAEDVVRHEAERLRPAPLLVVTESEDRACNRRLVRIGARGVVTLSRQGEHLVVALHRVHGGEIWLARSCISQLIDEMVASDYPSPPHLATPDGLDRLTEREREVVALIAQGMHNKAIAAELGITDHTVRHHLTAIFAKLGVADRLELAVYAFRHKVSGAFKR